MLQRDIYEIATQNSSIHGIMLRGTLRKLALKKEITLLLENAQDSENIVRFALLTHDNDYEQSLHIIIQYIHSKISDAKVEKVLSGVINPVLSKLKVNQEERYTL